MKKSLPPTKGIHYRSGLKAELKEKHWVMSIPVWFRMPLDFPGSWKEDHVWVTDALLQIDPEFSWNFANWFPDYEWVRTPSMVHDALLWFRQAMINSNIITEDGPEDKALKEDIDTVFMLLCKERLPRWARLTPKIMFIAVNRLSRLSTGSQARDHRIRYAP